MYLCEGLVGLEQLAVHYLHDGLLVRELDVPVLHQQETHRPSLVSNGSRNG